MLPEYMKRVKDTIYFKGKGELIYYVPEKYFDTKNAIVEGEYVELMGIFNYDVFNASGKARGVKLFKYPMMFRCKPSSITKDEMILKGTKTLTKYRLLHFLDGSELICSTRIKKSISNSEKFIDLLIRGNLPENLPYDEIYKLIPENANMNGFKYPLNNQMYGIIVSELCRDPKDLSRPFRVTKSTNMTDYKSMPILQIPKYVSPYTSITSENADEAIANAIINKSKTDSPLEKVMMN